MSTLERAMRTSNSHINMDSIKWESLRISEHKLAEYLKTGTFIFNQDGSVEPLECDLVEILELLDEGIVISTTRFHYRKSQDVTDRDVLVSVAKSCRDRIKSSGLPILAWDPDGRMFIYASRPTADVVHGMSMWNSKDRSGRQIKCAIIVGCALPYNKPKDWKTAILDTTEVI